MRPRPPREKRWVVRAGDGATVADIVRRAGEEPAAVEQGRVFVGRVRVKDLAALVKPGDEVRIGGAPSMGAAWSILWQRDGLLACSKPAGIPTVADHGGASHALVALAAAAVGRSAGELFVTSRLDREVSGVVVFGLSLEAEARLRRAREEGHYTRRYVALATHVDRLGRDEQGVRMWDAPIGRGSDARHRSANGPDGKPAQTRFRVVATTADLAMLAVEPQTGRTHQIRVHAGHAGMPLLGDRDYGGPARLTSSDGRVVALGRIALHAARVTVPDGHGAPLVAEAPIPDELRRIWTDLGGTPEAWDTAVSGSFATTST